MRRVYLTLAGCMRVLLLGVGLPFTYDRAELDLVLPNADNFFVASGFFR
jgi:hypothetical protein